MESHRDEILKLIRRKRNKEDLKRYCAVLSISLLMHAMIMFFISMIPPEDPFPEENVVIIETTFEVPDEIIEEVPQADIQVEEVLEAIEETNIEITDPKSDDQELEEVVEVEDEPEPMEEEPDELDDLLDFVEEGIDGSGELMNLALLGIGSDTGGANVPDAYKGRSSQKEKVRRSTMFGGGEKTLDAMEKALAWLAAHQYADGSWRYMGLVHAPKPGEKAVPKADVADDAAGKAAALSLHNRNANAITAISVLAFLGAGYSETSGKFRKNVSQAIKFLNRSVKAKIKKPLFERGYGSALVLMALAEASIFGSSPTTKANADAIAKMFMDMYEGERGWGYSGPGDDFSVSGWIALGLKSAKQAGLPSMNDKVTKGFYKTYGKWVTKMTNPETGLGSYREGKNGSSSMSYVGMFQKQFLGFPKQDPFLLKASEVAIKHIPQLFLEKGSLSEYQIYYGTLAAFQQQGELWKKWNLAMKKTLVTRQQPGDPEKLGGSWDPSDKHVGEHGGRVMSTAIYCLCLEVYFRYSLIK